MSSTECLHETTELDNHGKSDQNACAERSVTKMHSFQSFVVDEDRERIFDLVQDHIQNGGDKKQNEYDEYLERNSLMSFLLC